MAKKRERKKYKEQHNGEQAALSVCRIGETMGGQMWLHKTFLFLCKITKAFKSSRSGVIEFAMHSSF